MATFRSRGSITPAGFDYLATDTTFNYDAGNLVTPDPDPGRTAVSDGSGTCSYTTNNVNQYNL